MSEKSLIKELKASVRDFGLTSISENLNHSPQFICDVIRGRRGISERLANAMGYVRVITFKPKVPA